MRVLVLEKVAKSMKISKLSFVRREKLTARNIIDVSHKFYDIAGTMLYSLYIHSLYHDELKWL